MDAGADLLSKDALGLTALDLADKMDHTDCMEVLRGAVDRKEQEKQKNFYNLLDACAAGDINTVKTILGEGPLVTLSGVGWGVQFPHFGPGIQQISNILISQTANKILAVKLNCKI